MQILLRIFLLITDSLNPIEGFCHDIIISLKYRGSEVIPDSDPRTSLKCSILVLSSYINYY